MPDARQPSLRPQRERELLDEWSTTPARECAAQDRREPPIDRHELSSAALYRFITRVKFQTFIRCRTHFNLTACPTPIPLCKTRRLHSTARDDICRAWRHARDAAE